MFAAAFNVLIGGPMVLLLCAFAGFVAAAAARAGFHVGWAVATRTPVNPNAMFPRPALGSGLLKSLQPFDLVFVALFVLAGGLLYAPTIPEPIAFFAFLLAAFPALLFGPPLACFPLAFLAALILRALR